MNLDKTGNRRQKFWQFDSLEHNRGKKQEFSKIMPKGGQQPWLKRDEDENPTYQPFKSSPPALRRNREMQRGAYTPQPAPDMDMHLDPAMLHRRNVHMEPNGAPTLPARPGTGRALYSAQGRRLSEPMDMPGHMPPQHPYSSMDQTMWQQGANYGGVAAPAPPPHMYQQQRPLVANLPPRMNSRAGSEFGGGISRMSYCTLPRPDVAVFSTPRNNGGIHIDSNVAQTRLVGGGDMSNPSTGPHTPPDPKQKRRLSFDETNMMKDEHGLLESLEGDNNGVLDKITAWPTQLKLCILMLIVAMVIFGLGIARLVLLAKWALGVEVGQLPKVEVGYAVLAALCAMLGLIGSAKRHYCSMVACYVMAPLIAVLAIPPFINGLLVTVPDSFSWVERHWFMNEGESVAVSIMLAVMCLVQMLLSICVSAHGCYTFGKRWEHQERRNTPMAPNKLPVVDHHDDHDLAKEMNKSLPPMRPSISLDHRKS